MLGLLFYTDNGSSTILRIISIMRITEVESRRFGVNVNYGMAERGEGGCLAPCVNICLQTCRWPRTYLPDLTRVEAGSNTSTVNMRVVRGDEMGLKKAAP
jgi:hypothetical protein